MEHQLWKEIVALLRSVGKRKPTWRQTYDDAEIVKTWFWAVLHDRPVCWACCARHWPVYERKRLLPSAPTMSRRLGSDGVKQLLKWLEQQVLAPRQRELVWFIDGKPLTISGCSKDRQAPQGFGKSPA